jgi:hypothetical protein
MIKRNSHWLPLSIPPEVLWIYFWMLVQVLPELLDNLLLLLLIVVIPSLVHEKMIQIVCDVVE